MIDRGTIDKIFAAANVVDIVSEFVSLRRKGSNYQACCPFHNEKTPSFVVSPSKGLFKCFGCGKGGNAVTFVMEHENLNYVEALKYVAKKYGIEIEERERSPEEVRKNDDRESMMTVSHYASDYFVDYLHKNDEGRAIGLSYFQERGFSNKIIEKFRLGFCSADGDTFTQDAIAAGYKEEFLLSTGLTGKRERDGRLYDRFYGRVLFPIHGISGRVVAFGGRTLRGDKKVAKYVNSPESEIYHKSDILYGLFFAKKAITQDNCCILVEGYTDVISMAQAGVENVVSSSGTSLTVGQIRLVSRFTRNITVIYDGDSAGIKASLRGIDLILQEGLNVRMVLLPDGDDPDSFAKKHSSEELKEYIRSNEEDFISFKIRVLMAGVGSDPIKRAELITDIVTSISVVSDNIVRSLYITDSAKLLGISEQILIEEVARKRISHSSDESTKEFLRQQRTIEYRDLPQDVKRIKGGSSMIELEKELVKYLLKYGDMNFEYNEGKKVVELNVAEIIIDDIQGNGIVFQNSAYRAIYEHYLTLYSESLERDGEDKISMHNFINHHNPEVSNAVVDILTMDDNYRISELWARQEVVHYTEEEKLADIIPKAVILYKSKAIEVIIDELQDRLDNLKVSDPDFNDPEHMDALMKFTALNRERLSIATRLNRLLL